MTVDLSQFFQTFFEESAEHLAEMESIFLSIDTGNPVDADLDAVFRAAHSIKGGAATFGFPDMAAVTHTLETLLDRVRHHELALTGEMVQVFLEAGDAITMQLAGHRDGGQVEEARVTAICEKLQAIAGDGASLPAPEPHFLPDRPIEAAGSETCYRITFTPPANFFNRMVRMEPIFAELAELGELSTSARIDAPDCFEQYDHETCLVAWDLKLVTGASLDDIREVFLFVADEEELRFEVVNEQGLASGDEPAAVCALAGVPAPPASPGASPEPSGRRLETAGTPPGRRAQDSAEASSIRVGVSKVDQLINQMGELVITQAMLVQTAQKFDPVLHQDLHHGMELLQRSTRDLQESVMSIRMMPISFIFSRFPRLVHDLAAKLGKQVELKLVGEHTELDKGLIEKLADPLTHLVRNSLDHGIELPEERVAAGKNPGGTVTLRASQTGGRIVIVVEDDGAGLNRSKILKKAHENGLAVAEDMADEEVWQLIFAPGFSTADKVTDVSGRGVGMDVVLRNVQALGGRVSISSGQGTGSRVVVSLPLTLAILDGLSVQVGEEIFIVPINSIIESLQPRPDAVDEVGGNSTIRVRGSYLPLLRIGDVFGIAGALKRPQDAVVMIVEAEGEQVALLVDALLSQHQVVIKSLETNFKKVDGTAGATILGDGKVAMILDVADLVRLWRKR
jgi:two-component system, chemotaxis family, sensor kinase CheA